MPPETKNELNTISVPNRYSQYDSAFRRGKATSAAPICNGMKKLARPVVTCTANSSTIIVPCMVNTWL